MRRVGFAKGNPSRKQAPPVGRMRRPSGSAAAFLLVRCLASVYGNEGDSRARDWRPCHLYSLQFSCLVVSDFATSWTAAHQAPPPITNSRSVLKLTSMESVTPSTLSSPVVPVSSRLQSFPASGAFLTNHFFTSGGQSIGASASASVLPMDIQD